MNKPNTSRYRNDTSDQFTYNSNISFNSLVEDRNNNRTEQIKLRRNLLQSNFQIKDPNDEISTPKIISENSSLINQAPEEPSIPLITYQESYNYFQSLIFTNQNNNFDNDDDSGFCSCSSDKIKRQKYFIRNISRIKYDENNSIHFRILFSIYYFFTKKNCEKEGEHWQDIGFQGDSPHADLITVGMLGPLQILYGINNYPDFYSNLFQYLLKRKCDLFFAGNLISFSKFSLNLLERGILDDFGDNDNLFFTLNEIYVGMGYDFFTDIQNYGNGNILTIEFIVKTIQKISENRTQTNYFLGNHAKHYL